MFFSSLCTVRVQEFGMETSRTLYFYFFQLIKYKMMSTGIDRPEIRLFVYLLKAH